MDFDHFQRRSSQKFTGKIKPDFYNFESKYKLPVKILLHIYSIFIVYV